MQHLPLGAIHNSMLVTAKSCPQKYVYKYVWGYRKIRLGLPLTKGLWLHSMLQALSLKQGLEKGSLLVVPEELTIPGLSIPAKVDAENFLLYVDIGDEEELTRMSYPLSSGGMLKLLTELVYDPLPVEIQDDLLTSGLELPEACRRVMKSYLWAYRSVLPKERPLLVEHEFSVDVDGRVYQGRIDLLLEDSGKRITLRDWKTSTSIPTGSTWKLTESQLHIYPVTMDVVLDGLGFERSIDAVEFDFILSTPPGRPALVSKGTKLSRATKLMDPLSLTEAAKEAGLGMDDQIYITDKKNPDSPTLAEKLEEVSKTNDFFQRFTLPRAKKVTYQIFQENDNALKFIEELHESPEEAYRNTGRECDYMCEFKDVCVAHLYGLDFQMILNRDFEPWVPDDLDELELETQEA